MTKKNIVKEVICWLIMIAALAMLLTGCSLESDWRNYRCRSLKDGSIHFWKEDSRYRVGDTIRIGGWEEVAVIESIVAPNSIGD